jgi:hypothetical protein
MVCAALLTKIGRGINFQLRFDFTHTCNFAQRRDILERAIERYNYVGLETPKAWL